MNMKNFKRIKRHKAKNRIEKKLDEEVLINQEPSQYFTSLLRSLDLLTQPGLEGPLEI